MNDPSPSDRVSPHDDVPRSEPSPASSVESGDGQTEFAGSRSIGPYKIVRELGKGGQGLVFLADDTRLSRRVAIKVLSPQIARSQSTLARFRREAATASRLDHPGICSIYEAGEAGGVHYIAMRYVDGLTLAESIDTARRGQTAQTGPSEATGGDAPTIVVTDSNTNVTVSGSGSSDSPVESRTAPSSKDEVFRYLKLVERAARALHAAHEAGLIHRDIKPGNIIVDASGNPVILDFGLAREEGDSGGLTVSGDLLGTPAYMSPEQIVANRISLDRRTDIYSLAVTLYECLTLKNPFEAPTREGVYQRILSSDIPSPRKLNKHVSKDLRVVLETALDRDRDRRYKTALDFAEDLRRIREFEPIQARPASAALKCRRWVQRNPVLATAALALFLILSTGLGISLVLLDQVNRERLEKTGALNLAEQESQAKEQAIGQIRASEIALKARTEQLKKESQAKQQALVAMEASQAALEKESVAKEAALVNLQKALSEVQAQSQRASRLYLTGRASSVLRTNPAQALLLALEATAYEPGELTNGVLLKALRDDRELNVLRGTGESLLTAQFSSNGKLAATAYQARGVRLWETATGRCIRIMAPAGTRRLVALALSPDGSRLAMVCYNGRGYLLDVKSGKLIATLEGHAKSVSLTSVCFSPDGSLVLTTSLDGTARLWSAQDGKPVGNALTGHECGVAHARFSPDGKSIMTASDGRLYEFEFSEETGESVSAAVTLKNGKTSIRLYDVDSGGLIRAIRDLDGKVSVGVFSADGRTILTHCRNGVHLHDVNTGDLIWKPTRELRWNPAGGCVFAGDDTLIISDPVTGVASWNIKTRKQLQPFSGASGSESAVLSPNGKLLAARISGDEESIGIWQVATGKQLATLVGHEDRVTSMAFHPDGRSLITGSADGTARIWDVAVEKEFGDLVASSRLLGTQKMMVSQDGQRLVLVKSRKTEVIDCLDGRKISEILRRPSAKAGPLSLTNLVRRRPIRMAFFSGDGKMVISYFDNGRISFWDVDKEKFVWHPGTVGYVSGSAFSEDGKYVALVGGVAKLGLFHLSDGQLVKRWTSHELAFTPRFSPDTKAILVAPNARELQLTDIESGEPRWTIDVGDVLGGFAQLVTFDPQGQQLLLARENAPAVIVDVATGEKRGQLDDSVSTIHARFSPDGTQLLIRNEEQVGIWSAETGKRTMKFGEPSESFRSADLSPGGNSVVTISGLGRCRLWDSATGQTKCELLHDAMPVTSFEFSRDGQRVLTAAVDRRLHIWNVADGAKLLTIDHPSGDTVSANFSPDRTRILTVCRDGRAFVWDAETGQQLKVITRSSFGGLAGVDASRYFGFGDYILSQNGRRLVESSYNKSAGLRVFDTNTGNELVQIYDVSRQSATTLSPDGRHLLVLRTVPSDLGADVNRVSRPGYLSAGPTTPWLAPMLLDTKTGAVVRCFASLGFRPQRAWFNRDSSRIALVGWNGTAIVDRETGNEIRRVNGYGTVSFLQFHPQRDLAFFIASMNGGTGFLWDFARGRVQQLDGHAAEVTSGTFSSDGETLVTTSADKTARIWELATVRTIGAPLAGHRQAIQDAILSEDGKWLATRTRRKVRIWKLPEATPWLTISHAQPVSSMQFRADGRALLTLSELEMEGRVWPLDLPGAARGRLKRELTPDERARFDVGTLDEQNAIRQLWDARKLQQEVDLAFNFVEANPTNVAASAMLFEQMNLLTELLAEDLTDDARRIVEVTLESIERRKSPTVDIARSLAEVQARTGRVRAAIRTLEDIMDRYDDVGSDSPRMLDEYRRRIYPDLASYASVDAALEKPVTIIPAGVQWNCWKGTQPPSTEPIAWTQTDFDDSAWMTGKSGFGFGDDDDATVLDDMRNNYTTIYVRHLFDPPDLTNFEDYRLVVYVDDGFVAYLNGREIGRSRAWPPGSKLTYESLADSTVGDSETIILPVDASLFQDGKNVLAIQGLNRSLSSSDLTLIPTLVATPVAKKDSRQTWLEEFAAKASGDGAARRVEYARCRVLQLEGNFIEAIPRLQKLRDADLTRPEPISALAQCLIADGQPDRALDTLKAAMRDGMAQSRPVWDLWYTTSTALLNRPVPSIVDDLKQSVDGVVPDLVHDLQWSLETIERDGVIRINCGADKDHQDSQGRFWFADRLFDGGTEGDLLRPDPPMDVDFDALFLTERFFIRRQHRLPGYRIPLPTGRYRLTLHFTEAHFNRSGQRVFDVLVEGAKVQERYEPLVAGHRVREKFDYDITVEDGYLDIEFGHHAENPKLSAFEVTRQ